MVELVIVFTKAWAQEVADISGQIDYQNVILEIRDPSLVVRTGTVISGYSYNTATSVLWRGQGRVASTRTDVSSGGTTSTNPTSIKSMRVQIPYTPNFMRVKRGWEVRIVDGGRNSQLQHNLFMIESNVNSSNVGSITFHCSVDVESEPNWSS